MIFNPYLKAVELSGLDENLDQDINYSRLHAFVEILKMLESEGDSGLGQPCAHCEAPEMHDPNTYRNTLRTEP